MNASRDGKAWPPQATEVLFEEKFFRNRRGDIVVVAIKRSDAKACVLDIRDHYVDSGGIVRPTRRRVCVHLRKSPKLRRAIEKALGAASGLGLLPPQPSADDAEEPEGDRE
jgi:hypothetical protein